MNYLIAGAGGMVGSRMVELLHSRGKNVMNIYYKPTTDIPELLSDIKMMECDVRYPENIERIIFEYMLSSCGAELSDRFVEQAV